MKNIKKFDSTNKYDDFKNSDNYVTPNISLITNPKNVQYQKRFINLDHLTIIQHDDYNEYIKLDNTFGELNENGASYTMKFKAIPNGGESYTGNTQYNLIGDEAQTRFFVRRHINYQNSYSFRLFNRAENNILTGTEGYEITKTGTSGVSNTETNEYSTPFKSTYGELDIYMFGGFKEKDPNTYTKFWFGDFYYFQLLKGDTMLLDIIPMRDGKLKVDGVYDKVKQKFYPLVKHYK